MSQRKIVIIMMIVAACIAGINLVKNIPNTKDKAPEVVRVVEKVKDKSGKYMPFSKETFIKPADSKLRAMLTPLQYEVTQEEGTERPYANEYFENILSGLYVDIVSGEPLFSSKDKYDSGTGWPSFVKPISKNVVTEKMGNGVLLGTRVEIRSRVADSHLGHVFDDGPQDRGGKRYCMNSAAMRFIPKQDMDKLGYGEYLQFVE